MSAILETALIELQKGFEKRMDERFGPKPNSLIPGNSSREARQETASTPELDSNGPLGTNRNPMSNKSIWERVRSLFSRWSN